MVKNIKNILEKKAIKYYRTMGCVFISLFCLLIFVKNLIPIYELNYLFKSTSGIVLQAELEKVYQSTEDGEGSGWFYIPKIEYQYEVEGVKLTGNRYRPSNRGEEEHIARKILTNYPIGKSITVFYKIDNPKASLLTKELSRQSITVTLGTGFIFIIASILGIFFWYKSYKHE
jgi:hypothetical protein